MIFRSLALTLVALAFTIHSSDAASIVQSGTVTGFTGLNNDEVDQWRSASVFKSFDIDGDNIYGTAGYALYSTDALGNANGGIVVAADPLTYLNGTRATLASLPSFLVVTNNGQSQVASSYGYKQMDDPRLSGELVSDVESGGALRGVAIGTEGSLFDLTVGAGFPTAGLRLGIIFGNSDVFDGTFRFTQVTGGNATATYHETIPTGGADLGIAFFDITNAVEGDVFTFYITKTSPQPVGGNMNANVIYGGLTFDAIPEPTSAISLMSGSMIALLGNRRRTRKN